jgi:hypothetical protein
VGLILEGEREEAFWWRRVELGIVDVFERGSAGGVVFL